MLFLVTVVALAAIQAPVSAAPGDDSDLSITGSGSAAGVKVGHDVTFTFKATNQGPDAATNVAAEVVLEPGLSIVAADAPGGTCTTTPTVVCNKDSLDAGGAWRITVRATSTATGAADATGAVESDSTDVQPTDNTATVTTQIGPESSKCDLWGTAGKDRIRSGREGEVICGYGGNDRLAGAGGRDTLIGGAGRDRLNGGAGRDRLIGGAGEDRCRAARAEVRTSCS